ncbi:glycosyltransferase family 4 protein [Christiangramia echinicola]|uniref:glycosyltransferase family 4 protein n=1 Tax=Christiangramia echinicola TaxID=279359 RepID=UPI000414324E|nr:glycosyltransferase family 4 protein [Christiangramia echinicola]
MGNKVKTKIILSHPTGNANVRAVADGFLKIGVLSSFYTCIAIFKDSRLFKLSGFWFLKEFRRRSFNPKLKSFTKIRPLREFGRLISQKVGFKMYIKHEKGIFSVDKVYRDLDKHVAKKLNGVNAIYAYEDGALESFKKAKANGIKCFYELPTGYWRAHKKFLGEELIKRPDWAPGFNCFLNSSEKLTRKDEELALADLIFVASDFTKRTLELYPENLGSIHIVPYGFPEVSWERSYFNLKNRRLKILFVGLLSQQKGVANILEAMNQLDEKVELTMVGRKSIQNCGLLENGIKKHTWFPSLPHNKVIEIMKDHDILLFPSLFEGYGLVITESMAQGTPVITTKRTCGANFIENGVNGWFVKPGCTNSIVQKINSILEETESLEKIGRAAMLTAKALPINTYGERVARAIKSYMK